MKLNCHYDKKKKKKTSVKILVRETDSVENQILLL